MFKMYVKERVLRSVCSKRMLKSVCPKSTLQSLVSSCMYDHDYSPVAAVGDVTSLLVKKG